MLDSKPDKQFLGKGDAVELSVGKPITFQYPHKVTLTLECVDDHTLNAILKHPNGIQIAELHGHNLGNSDFSTPLAIGRQTAESTLITVPAIYTSISRSQASIALENSKIIYTHLGTNKIKNPFFNKTLTATDDAPEGKIETAGVSAGGFTTENISTLNERTTNEDRVGAFHATDKTASEAETYLSNILNTASQGAANHSGDSTLSLAMHTEEGQYACAFIGDSPFYLVGKNKATDAILVQQMFVPHDIAMQMAAAEAQEAGETSLITQKIIEAACKHDSKIIKYLANTRWRSSVSSSLKKPESKETHVIDPQAQMPQGFECLGLMVCSDGIESGVENNAVQKALQELLQKNQAVSPADICECAVNAAKDTSPDNISAAFLPIGEKGLIAVADGFKNSAETAQAAMKIVASKCPQPTITTRSSAARGANQ